MGIENSHDDGKVRCPYCQTTQDCAHLLLLVDTVDREAKGGALYKAFNTRWFGILDEGENDHDFRENESFDDLLSDVGCLADVQIESNFEGGPGMSTDYVYCFCSSKQKTDDAVKSFSTR